MAKQATKTRLQTETEWLEALLEFMSYLSVDSKETGVGPLELYGSQRRALAEIIEGLSRGIHLFVCLKAMQLGMSTLMLAIDLFWLATHPGMQGVLVTDSEGNKNKFRVILRRFISGLPPAYKITLAKGGDNRERMEFTNGSVLDFLVAGTRSTATEVGRSRAYNFAHITEAANFGAIEGIVSLLDRLAEKNPDRLYIIESTAKGYNLFWHLWQKAKQDPDSQKAFFIGWWAKEDYSLDSDDPRFAKYWDGMVDAQEQARVNEVWDRYGHQVTPNQIAWFRWKTDQSSETALIDQNFPWTEDDAFLATGQTFVRPRTMGKIIALLTKNPPPFKGYAYEFGDTFMETRCNQVRTVEEAQLKVYEEPSPMGSYVMGVDPAYGRSENQDRSVVQVCRCYADRLVQVAEFASAEPESFQCAWVMAHLAGLYKNIMIIVEISGPGEATILELKHLRQLFDAGALPGPAGGDMTDLFGGARWYMYHRSDSPGPGYCYNWRTSLDNKLSILGQLRDSLTINLIEIRSISCAMEIQGLEQDGFSIAPAISTNKDDRVFGLAFAHRAWVDWVRGPMIANMETWERVTAEEKSMVEGSHSTMVSHIVSEFFASQQKAKEERAAGQAWSDEDDGDDGEFDEEDYEEEYDD